MNCCFSASPGQVWSEGVPDEQSGFQHDAEDPGPAGEGQLSQYQLS